MSTHRPHAYTHTHIRTYTRTHIHTYTCTHTHIHTQCHTETDSCQSTHHTHTDSNTEIFFMSTHHTHRYTDTRTLTLKQYLAHPPYSYIHTYTLTLLNSSMFMPHLAPLTHAHAHITHACTDILTLRQSLAHPLH